MYRFLTCAFFGVATLASASLADAQIVRWGPGGVSIRAPFVGVDVSPFGGTRVRAPFTAVGTRVYGGYAYPPGVVVGPVVPPIPFPRLAVPVAPVYPVPVYPGVVYPEPAPMTYQSARPNLDGTLPEQLRYSAETLARSLAVRQDGDVWLDYLGPQKIIETIDLGRSPEALRPLVINYDGVLSNGSLASIRGARGFAETRELLKVYVAGGGAPSPVPAPNSATTPAESGVIARPGAAVRTQPVPTPPQPVEESLPLPAPDASPEPAPEDGGTQAPVPPPPSPRPPVAPTPL